MPIKLLCVFQFVLLLNLVRSYWSQQNFKQAELIVKSMSLDQKIGQTIQIDFVGLTHKNQTSDYTAAKYSIGSILVGGDGCPDENGNRVDFSNLNPESFFQAYANATVDKWQKLGQKFNYTVDVTANNGKTYKIKSLLATDAVHGDQHVAGSILFPHNIGLSCSHNLKHFYNTGYWTAASLKKYGFNYAFAPTVAVSHNPQWGRFYETMGQESDKIYEYAKSYTEGVQGKPGQYTGILGSVKHFFADGATFYGADEGNSVVNSWKTFVYHNTQGYNGSISSNIGSVMASYSAINFVPLSSGSYLKSILRNDLGFEGFVISDYSQLEKLSSQHLPTSLELMPRDAALATMFTAGIDIFMIPSKFSMVQYISFIKSGIQKEIISIDRLNQAVSRILAVKIGLGLIQTNQDKTQIFQKRKQQKSSQYQDSLDAVHQSLVLLKNQNLIPVQASSLQYIVLVGEKIININNLAKHELFLNYDNIGMQSGGWTGRWQGFEGNPLWQGQNKISSNASSILDALKNLNQKLNLVHPNYTTFTDTTKIAIEREKYLESLKTLRKNMNAKNTLILSVVGESPYAEMVGDINIPYCQNKTLYENEGCIWWSGTYSPPRQGKSLDVSFSDFDRQVLQAIKERDQNIPLLTVLLSGRPMIINEILAESAGFISAFLPGTSGGQGIVDAIFGDYVFRPNGVRDGANSLSFDWPRSMDQLKDFPYYGADGQIPKIEDPLFKVGYGLSTVDKINKLSIKSS